MFLLCDVKRVLFLFYSAKFLRQLMPFYKRGKKVKTIRVL